MSNYKMREAFEKWITTEGYPGYAIDEIDAGSLNLAAAAWQAALTQQPESEELSEYLHDGESVLECIKRHREGAATAVRMLTEERVKVAQLAAQQPESQEPVGEIGRDPNGCLEPQIYSTFDIDAMAQGTKIYTSSQPSAQVPTPAMIAAGADKVTVIDCAETVAERVYLAMRSADTTPQPAALPEGARTNVSEILAGALSLPLKPLPDPYAHSHEAYAKALHAVFCEIRFKIMEARKALSAAPPMPGKPPEVE